MTAATGSRWRVWPGIPREVITRAREVLNNLESGEFITENLPALARGAHAPNIAHYERDQLSLFSQSASRIRLWSV